ncbi:MAG: AAA family ATPase, partial [Alistipes sp.]|nr:AAA family ATPase [Alistipes sp.]
MQTISITNLKGGVGKTTTAINLACRLATTGKKVLLLDIDHQSNLSEFFGGASTDDFHQLIVGTERIIPQTVAENLDLIPSDMDTATINFKLIGQLDWHSRLKKRLQENGFYKKYDFCIIDCPPALDMIVTNALMAADYILIPLTPGRFAYDGLENILERIEEVKECANPTIEILGILLTMVSNRTRATRSIVENLKRHGLDIRTCDTRIRQCEAFKQAELD